MTESEVSEEFETGEDGNIRKSLETYNFDVQSNNENENDDFGEQFSPELKGKVTVTLEEVSSRVEDEDDLPCD